MSSSKFPVTKQPYDARLEENMSMYDKLPYKRNEDMCNASTLALVSGNLVKFYRCAYDEPAEIDTQDDNFNSIVSEHIRKQEKEIALLHQKFPTLYGTNETDEDEEYGLPDEGEDMNEE